jgi:hypothetical protein
LRFEKPKILFLFPPHNEVMIVTLLLLQLEGMLIVKLVQVVIDIPLREHYDTILRHFDHPYQAFIQKKLGCRSFLDLCLAMQESEFPKEYLSQDRFFVPILGYRDHLPS